jgi:hypothetical protein
MSFREDLEEKRNYIQDKIHYFNKVEIVLLINHN